MARMASLQTDALLESLLEKPVLIFCEPIPRMFHGLLFALIARATGAGGASDSEATRS